jgi:exodeoxyribonuclease VII large subunit
VHTDGRGSSPAVGVWWRGVTPYHRAMTADRVLTVAAITRRIAEACAAVGPVVVSGELTQVKAAASGHFYATLKDPADGAVISLVMWKSQVLRMGRLPPEGSKVEVRGSIEVYPPRGSYQLIATRISLAGAGDLLARLEALKARLAGEGLFDEEAKRPLPILPRAVGIATATGSAALADMLDSIRRRFPTMAIVHAPCLVQGPGAAAAIVAALDRLDRHGGLDVVIVGRGGGSLEDLWAFNEEAVVRRIAAMSVPTISAVGHETDWTLADLAADIRAKTPTEAGELVVPVLAELTARLGDARDRLDQSMADLLTLARQRLAGLTSHRALAQPGFQVAMRRQRLDELAERLDHVARQRLADEGHRLAALAARLRSAAPAVQLTARRERSGALAKALVIAADERLRRAEERLARAAARLDALSPLAVIARGYSVVRAEGRVVRTLAEAPPGTLIEARMSDGWIAARVEGARRQRLNEPETGYQA